MRKIIFLLIAFITLCFMTACGPAPAPDDSKPQVVAGTYIANGWSAVVTDTTIEVKIVDADSESLYWKGTFNTDTNEVASMADREALDASLLGSQDEAKKFTLSGRTISFRMTMMGTTKTITLKKV